MADSNRCHGQDHVSENREFSTCSVAVISNHTMCDVCVLHGTVSGEIKLSTVLGFLV